MGRYDSVGRWLESDLSLWARRARGPARPLRFGSGPAEKTMSSRVRSTASFRRYQNYRRGIMMCSGGSWAPGQPGQHIGGHESYLPQYQYRLSLFRCYDLGDGGPSTFKRSDWDGKVFNNRWEAEMWVLQHGYEEEYFRSKYHNGRRPTEVYARKFQKASARKEQGLPWSLPNNKWKRGVH